MEDILRQLHAYVHGMWRFRWWGLVVAWIVGVASAVGIYLMPDKYQSTARIYVDTQSVLRPLMHGLAVQPNIKEQVAMLSRTLITRPNVEKLITMADLDLGIHNKDQRENLISRLSSELKIEGTGRDNLFTLSYKTTDPQRARRVVQALVSLFVESGLVSKRQDANDARRFIEEQIQIYEKKLSDAENRMKEFRLKHMMTVGDGARDYVGRISDEIEQVNQARLELSEAENSRDALKKQMAEAKNAPPPPVATMALDATPELDSRIESLKQNLDSMLLRYTDEHPDVVNARRVIKELEEQKRKEIESRRAEGTDKAAAGAAAVNPVVQQMEMVLAQAEAKVASLQARVAEHEKRLEGLRAQAQLRPEVEAEMAQLNRDYAINKSNYEALVSRRESATMSAEMGAQGGVADFRLIDPPTLPTSPSAPNRVLLMPLAGLVSLLIGMVVSFLVSQLRPSFGDGRSLRDITGLPVLGTVSLVPDPGRRRRERRGLFAFVGGVGGFVGAMVMMTVTVHLLQG